MRTEITKEGKIVITPLSGLEAFALKQIIDKWLKPEHMWEDVIVKTEYDVTN